MVVQFVYFYMILKLSHARYLVSMADNGTEVISLGGEHGAVAVCMKTFNGQYNIQTHRMHG